jgi:hypothetical protein
VAAHQRLEGHFIRAGQQALDQLPVGLPGQPFRGHPPRQSTEEASHPRGRHVYSPSPRLLSTE